LAFLPDLREKIQEFPSFAEGCLVMAAEAAARVGEMEEGGLIGNHESLGKFRPLTRFILAQGTQFHGAAETF
jgi:hypothetical protein